MYEIKTFKVRKKVKTKGKTRFITITEFYNKLDLYLYRR